MIFQEEILPSPNTFTVLILPQHLYLTDLARRRGRGLSAGN